MNVTLQHFAASCNEQDRFGDDHNYVRLNSTYLHGELENLIGYDIYLTSQCDVITREMVTYNNGVFPEFMIKEGIYNSQVTDIGNGNVYNCTSFYWNDRFGIKGLTVLTSDITSMNHAMKKFNEKSSSI